MKLTKLKSAALVLAAAAAFNTAAHAQTYNVGDLFLGFEQQNGSGGVTANDYVVDLGAVSQFIQATGPLTFQLSTSDLTSAFGSSWASNTGNQVQWGVFGASDSNGNTINVNGSSLNPDTLFLTKGRTSTGTQSIAPKEFKDGPANNDNNIFGNFENDYTNQTLSSGSTSNLQSVIEGSGGANSWSSLGGSQATPLGFGTNYNLQQALTGANGPTNSVLDLYRLNTYVSGAAPSGIYLGDYSLSNSGLLTFSPSAAPEPSTYALMFMGLGLLVWRLRRKTVAAI